jgi:hypothetical protein
MEKTTYLVLSGSIGITLAAIGLTGLPLRKEDVI